MQPAPNIFPFSVPVTRTINGKPLINDVVLTLADIDTTQGLAVEIAARIAGDLILSARITAEIAARFAGDASLLASLNSEIAARILSVAGKQDTIIRGSATLDGSGTVTVTNANTPIATRIFLHTSSGNSNMTIKISSVTVGVSFTITSAGGPDDAGLEIGWHFL